MRALCLAPGGPGSNWNYLEALERLTGVSGRFVCGFHTSLHLADTCSASEQLLNFVFCDDFRVVDKTEICGMKMGTIQRKQQFRGTTYLIGFSGTRISDLIRQIGSHSCHIRNGTLTRIQHSPEFQLLTMISSISSHLSHSCPYLYTHLRTWMYIIPLYLSMA